MNACTRCRVEGEPLALFGDAELCDGCWHQARERTPPFHVRSRSNPRLYSHAAYIPVVYTLAEARAQAKKINAADPTNDFEPVAAPDWTGERIAHPGYMVQRRRHLARVLAAPVPPKPNSSGETAG